MHKTYGYVDLYSNPYMEHGDPRSHEDFMELVILEEQIQEDKTREFLMERYKSLLKGAKEKEELTERAYQTLSAKPLTTMDELDEAYSELIHLLQNKDYYNLLERIEKGERMRDEEKDPKRKAYYEQLLKQRYAELEKLMPRSESA